MQSRRWRIFALAVCRLDWVAAESPMWFPLRHVYPVGRGGSGAVSTAQATWSETTERMLSAARYVMSSFEVFLALLQTASQCIGGVCACRKVRLLQTSLFRRLRWVSVGLRWRGILRGAVELGVARWCTGTGGHSVECRDYGKSFVELRRFRGRESASLLRSSLGSQGRGGFQLVFFLRSEERL